MDAKTQIEENFASDSFRKHQKETAKKILTAFESGVEVAVLSAPTGFGKSLVLECIGQCYDDAFYTAPLNTLIDQMNTDDLIGDRVYPIKGQSNYFCELDSVEPGTTVAEAPCQDDRSFNCTIKDSKCPYYTRKMEAKGQDVVVTNPSFLMADSKNPADPAKNPFKLGNRDVLIVDECQNLEDYAINAAKEKLSKNIVPDKLWGRISIPDYPSYEIEKWRDWIENGLIFQINERMSELEKKKQKHIDKGRNVPESLTEKIGYVEDLRYTYTSVYKYMGKGPWVVDVERNEHFRKPDEITVEFKPVIIDNLLDDLLWSRGMKIIISSATIPGDKSSGSGHKWLSEIGLGDKDLRYYSVPHTFPVHHRPIYGNLAAGKMTKDERKTTIPDMANTIKHLATNRHSGQKGIVHCRSYGIAESIYNEFSDSFQNQVELQGQYNRSEALGRWQDDSNRKQLFLSVNMAEGIDLKGDACEWQIVAKTLYPHIKDAIVEYRIEEMNDWNWYNQQAAIQLQQAYGRAVRTPQDKAHFYILDQSGVDLIKRNAELFQTWFLEAIKDFNIDPSRGI